MEPALIDLIAKNPFSFGTFVVAIAAGLTAIYRYLVGQADKKDLVISKKDDAINGMYNDLISHKIDPILAALKTMSEDIKSNTQETSEANKLISNLLIIMQEHKKP